jgi:hypothetical protein
MTTDPFARLRDLVAPQHPTADPVGRPAETVTGGYGVVPGAKHAVNTNVPAPVRKITTRDAANLMNAEILTALRELVESTTQLTAAVGRQGSLNGVIRVGAYRFDATGTIELSHPVTVGSAIVFNTGLYMVTVQLGPGAAASVPGLGQGFFRVPAGAFVPVPIGQKAFVLYGTAEQEVSVQAFTGMQPFGVAL